MDWPNLDDPDGEHTVFHAILMDRLLRIDSNKIMADRPPFIVVTEEDGRVVRLEMYEGHDYLECTYDLRSAELIGRDLPLYMPTDPCGYDPAEFMAEMFGIPKALIRAWQRATHDPDSPGLACNRKG